MGYIGWIGTFEGRKGTGKERVFESELVRELRVLGAVLYCKTSVPHTLMSNETMNNIIDQTSNPVNRLLSAGGSSGGEGALIALRGSPLGFGTDIGGSMRYPAAACGLFGLKPSSGRLPYEGTASSMDGQNTVLPAIGPMAPSVADLRLAMTAVLSQQPWLKDPTVHNIPWREDIERETRRQLASSRAAFGIFYNEAGLMKPHPPLIRALDTISCALGDLGHKVEIIKILKLADS